MTGKSEETDCLSAAIMNFYSFVRKNFFSFAFLQPRAVLTEVQYFPHNDSALIFYECPAAAATANHLQDVVFKTGSSTKAEAAEKAGGGGAWKTVTKSCSFMDEVI